MKTVTKIIAIVAILSTSLFAYAEGDMKKNGFYVGVSYGITKHKIGGFEDLKKDFDVSADFKDKGYKVFFGKNLTDNFAIEAQYSNLGKAKYYDKQPDGSIYSPSHTIKGYGVAGVVKTNVGSFTPFVKIGAHRSTSKFRGDVNTSSAKTKVFYGLGVNFNIEDGFAIRAEFEQFNAGAVDYDAADKYTFNAKVKYFSIGIVKSF